MENQQRSSTITPLPLPLLNGTWSPHNVNNNYYLSLSSNPKQQQQQIMDEQIFKNSFMCTTIIELEAAKLAAQDHLRRRDEELSHLRSLLLQAIRERNEAQEQCQRLHLQNILLQTHSQKSSETHNNPQIINPPPAIPTPAAAAPVSGTTTVDVEYSDQPSPPAAAKLAGTVDNVSDCDESTVSSPAEAMVVAPKKPLPEKGRLLQAVMKAGPLLQTLLLAGPLPQWRHPPPPLNPFDIPPVGIGADPLTPTANYKRKGGGSSCVELGDGDELESPDNFSRPYKYQRVVTNSIS